MPGRNRNPYQRMYARPARRRRPPWWAFAVAALIVVVAIAALLIARCAPRPDATATVGNSLAPAMPAQEGDALSAQTTPPPVAADQALSAQQTLIPDEAAALPSATPLADAALSGGENLSDDAYTESEVLSVRPTAMPGGYLPIFSKAKTEEKIIAITVDDCNQTENLRQIVDCAVANGGKLTIFPIGKNLAREGLQEVIRYAYEQGMEFENHSYNHSTFYRLDAETMAAEIYNANRALSMVLGVDYQMHFMRTRGGDNRRDLRTHQYLEKLGYYGMAHWTMSGSSSSVSKLKSTLAPGNIYLFHTKDYDLQALKEFIPYAVSQGYRLVTLTEMFGYPDNEATPITTPLEEREVPQPDPYVYDYKELNPDNNYIWDVYLLQQRLVELGWLEDTPDGVYGQNTYNAVGYFQLAAGIQATGSASPETQEVLFSDAAPRAGETLAAAPTSIAPVMTTTPRAQQTASTVDMTIFD